MVYSYEFMRQVLPINIVFGILFLMSIWAFCVWIIPETKTGRKISIFLYGGACLNITSLFCMSLATLFMNHSFFQNPLLLAAILPLFILVNILLAKVYGERILTGRYKPNDSNPTQMENLLKAAAGFTYVICFIYIRTLSQTEISFILVIFCGLIGHICGVAGMLGFYKYIIAKKYYGDISAT